MGRDLHVIKRGTDKFTKGEAILCFYPNTVLIKEGTKKVNLCFYPYATEKPIYIVNLHQNTTQKSIKLLSK